MKSTLKHDLSFQRVDGPALCMECYTNIDIVDKCKTCNLHVCNICMFETSIRWKHEICRSRIFHRGIDD